MKKLLVLAFLWPLAAAAQVGTYPALVGQRGTTLPTNCAVGQLFFKSDATAGANIYECASANTWTQQAGGAAGSVALSSIATQATNTVVGNATSGTASPTALAVGSCSTASSALKWTTNTGFGCNTSITATTNANLTGPITSAGNATSIASQTGTGTSFVVSVNPTLTGAVSATPITNGILVLDGTGANPATGSGGGLLLKQQDSGAAQTDYFSITGARVNQAGNNQVATTFSTGSPTDAVAMAATMTMNTDGTITLPRIAAAAGNELLCYNTAGGAVTYAATVLGCVPSAFDLKNPVSALDQKVALTSVLSLQPGSYVYKDEQTFSAKEYVGLYADDVCAMDERLCGRGKKDEVANYDKIGLTAYLVAAMKEQQAMIEKLQKRIDDLVGVKYTSR